MNVYVSIVLEFLLISFSVLILFKYRKRIGLAPLYILLGAVQYIQALSASMIKFVVFDKFTLYPGSVILFSAVLFAVLLIYIKEGVSKARTLIFGIIISNFLLSLLFEITYQQELIVGQNDLNKLSVFFIDYKYFIVGTIILLLDFFLLVVIYQYLISKTKQLPYFIILFGSLLVVLIFDAFTFNFVLKFGTPDFINSLISHIIGKSISAFIFSAILYFYLKYFDLKTEYSSFIANQKRDIFSIIRYQKKYLDLKVEKEKVEKKLVSQLESTLNNISDGFVSLDTNWCYTFINNKAGEFLGRKPESLMGKHIWTEFPDGVGLPFYDAYYKAVETQETIYFNEYYKPFDKWFENRIYPSKDGLAIYFTDITDKKKAETNNQMLLSLIETSYEFIGLATLKGKPLYLNKSGRNLIGLDSKAELPNSIKDFFPESYHDIIEKEHIPSIFENNKWRGEVAFKNFKTGNLIPMEMSGFLIRDHVTNEPIALGNVAADITERKIAENEIKEIQKKLEAAIRIGKIGYWSWDIVKDEVFWSDLMYKIYDVKIGTPLRYDSVIDCVHPEDRDFHNNLVEQRIKNKSSEPFEYRVLCKDKTIKYVMVQMEVVENNQGEAIKFQGTVIDITELKEAENAIKESEEKFSKVFHSSQVGFSIVNMEGVTVDVNKAMAKLVESTPEHLIGKTVEEAEIDIMDDAYHEQNNRLMEKIQKQGYLHNEIVNKKLVSGKKLNTLISAEIIEINSVPYILTTAIDITDRVKAEEKLKETEERYRLLAEKSIDALFMADANFKFTYVNNRAIELLGYSYDEFLQLTIPELNLVEPGDPPLMIGDNSKGLDNIHERKMICKDGSILHVDISGKKLEDGSYMAFVRDITERKKTEKELEKHRNNLEELVKLRTEELDLKNAELQRMNKLFVGRELKMKELKTMIKELQTKKK